MLKMILMDGYIKIKNNLFLNKYTILYCVMDGEVLMELNIGNYKIVGDQIGDKMVI